MQRPGWLDTALYPFAPQMMDHGPGKMHYIDEGAGEPIVFVHGTPSWSFEWRHLITALAPSYRCVAPDLLGFGLSDKPTDFGYTPAAHADTLKALIRGLNLRDITLVVHDFGGSIGLSYALAFPENVKRIVIMNTWMWPVSDPTWPASARTAAKIAAGPIGKFLYLRLNFSARVLLKQAWINRRTFSKHVHEQYVRPFASPADRLGTWAFARALSHEKAWFDAQWATHEILAPIPKTFVWGMADPAVGPAHLERFTTAFPDAPVHRLPGIGHWVSEEAPADTITIIQRFMAPDRPDNLAVSPSNST